MGSGMSNTSYKKEEFSQRSLCSDNHNNASLQNKERLKQDPRSKAVTFYKMVSTFLTEKAN